MNTDIVRLVQESMEKMGCGDAVAGKLDAHSPICIGFHSMPEMYVELDNGNVVFTSQLDYRGAAQLERVAVDLLGYLLPRGSDVFVCRRPLLSLVDNDLLLHARVEERFTENPDTFTQAMEAFYEDLCAISEILGR
ncbi:Surface presentation of antigens protein SpaK [Pandoraea horticolens]|uniref:Surface presentation of antigens protein SpaK n=1 Tax=Pandoraea horticolens TaxID=2508298 RepID=A0A5E4XLF3_9BURK|nr:hypothetical protein [Pandoraea horticolens]VVE36965.1 Surface presentation of antigens protein SpaK [Pandoraea horticolens]